MGFAAPKLNRPRVQWFAALTGQKAEAAYLGWLSPRPSGLAGPPARRNVRMLMLVPARRVPVVMWHPAAREATGSSTTIGESTGAVPRRHRA
jgi:hypothetical protein